MLPPHARNRITVVQVRKTDHMAWIEWGINNGVDHTLLGWVKDNPHLFASFEDVKDPEDNPYISNQLPSRESIKKDPMNAKVPDSASAVCMVVYRSLASMDKDYLDPWMDYMARLDKEAQGMFANGVRSPKYAHQSMVMGNKKFTQWAMDNNYMFAADKK